MEKFLGYLSGMWHVQSITLLLLTGLPNPRGNSGADSCREKPPLLLGISQEDPAQGDGAGLKRGSWYSPKISLHGDSGRFGPLDSFCDCHLVVSQGDFWLVTHQASLLPLSLCSLLIVWTQNR